MDRYKNKYYKNAVLAYSDPERSGQAAMMPATSSIADNLIKSAIEHHGPVRNNPGLLSTIARLNSGGGMPESVYSAVGGILDFLYLSDKKMYDKIKSGVEGA
ncbi:MAG: hypothetical protein ACLFQX_10550 [Candidatus Kapaibacterium sp.]